MRDDSPIVSLSRSRGAAVLCQGTRQQLPSFVRRANIVWSARSRVMTKRTRRRQRDPAPRPRQRRKGNSSKKGEGTSPAAGPNLRSCPRTCSERWQRPAQGNVVPRCGPPPSPQQSARKNAHPARIASPHLASPFSSPDPTHAHPGHPVPTRPSSARPRSSGFSSVRTPLVKALLPSLHSFCSFTRIVS